MKLIDFSKRFGQKSYLIICHSHLIKIKSIIFMGIMALAKRLYFAALSVLIATRERLKKQVVVFVFLTLPLFT